MPETSTPWFACTDLSPSLSLITEPYVDPLLRANTWVIRGSERTLFVDAGLGVGSLRTAYPDLFQTEPLLLMTHAHLDHAGGAGEFETRLGHEREDWDAKPARSLRGYDVLDSLGLADCTRFAPETAEWLVEATADLREQERPTTRPTAYVADDDVIDLGDRRLEVLHLPGHTPGSIALLDRGDGALYSGDVLYDDDPLDCCAGADPAAYAESMRRLLGLDGIDTVRPGHDRELTWPRAQQVAQRYLDTPPRHRHTDSMEETR